MEDEHADIVNKVAKLHGRIEKLLARIEIASLPSVTLQDPSTVKALPEHVGGLYFITHAEQGLLYIGKAYNLKRRFGFHEHINAAMVLGGVTVSWLELPCELNILCEEIFIAERAPKWNKVIPMRSTQHRLNRMFKDMRERDAYDRGLANDEDSDKEGEREENDIGQVVCRYCQMEYMKRGLKRHQRTCKFRPSWEKGRLRQ